MAAKHLSYFDDWKNELLTCPKCGWSGTFSQGSVEYFSDLMDCSCPVCGSDPPKLAMVSYPSLREAEANFDRLSEEDKRGLESRRRFLDDFERSCLRSIDQLPDISTPRIALSWDLEDDDSRKSRTIIRHGEQIVWSEPAIWEGYERFQEVVAILKQKYGEQLVDVVPTNASSTYLYGDCISAIDLVEQVRMGLRDAEGGPNSP